MVAILQAGECRRGDSLPPIHLLQFSCPCSLWWRGASKTIGHWWVHPRILRRGAWLLERESAHIAISPFVMFVTAICPVVALTCGYFCSCHRFARQAIGDGGVAVA